MDSGDFVKFTGTSDLQVTYGGHDDPRPFLEVGGKYQVDDIEIHDAKTHVMLVGFDGKFNSVCFDVYEILE